MIKVLQIAEDLNVGGLERVIQGLALWLPKEKYDVEVWCLTRGGTVADELRSAGVKVEILGMGPRCTLPFLWALRGRMRRCGAQVVHCHAYTANTIGRTAAFLVSIPVIISHEHSSRLSNPLKQVIRERVLAPVTGRVLCCSCSVAAAVTKAFGLPPEKVSVVYNGARDMSGMAGGRDRFGIPAGVFVAGMAASMVPNKGHSVFLRAFREVLKAHPGAKALLAGDGPLRAALESEAAVLGIGADVVFAGTLNDMRPFYSAMDLLVQPSKEREGLPLSVLEAMSNGVPVIASKLGGIPEVLSDGETGVLVQPGDAQALAAAINDLIADPEKAAGMGRAARALYERNFTLAGMIGAVDRIYEELLR